MKRIKQNGHYIAASLGIGGLLAAGLMGGGTPLFDTPESFVLLAKEQITIGSNISLSSGDIGVDNSSEKITIGAKGSISGNLYADTVIFGAQNTINGSVTAKRLTEGSGTEILGETFTAFSSPLVSPFPTVPDFTIGTQNLNIRSNTSQAIPPGSYRNITAGSKNTLIFIGGVYNIDRLTVGSNSTLIFQAPTTLNIQSTAVFGSKNIFLLAPALTLEDVRFNMKGKTVTFGADNFISGIVTAPDATIALGSKTTFRGQLIGKKIVIGSNVILSLSESFSILTRTEDIRVTEDGTRFVINQILLQLTPTGSESDAGAIASTVGGTIIGILPSINLYQVGVPTNSEEELNSLIQQLQNSGNPLIKTVSLNIILNVID